MNPLYKNVHFCRVCGSDNIASLNLTKNYYLLNLDQTVDLSYMVCIDCQFIFHGEYVGDDFLNHYYKHSSMLRRKEATKFEINQNEMQARFLKRNIDITGLKVLEIGAHAGAFLVHLHNMYNCQCFFNELSEDAVNILASQEGLKDFRLVEKSEKMDLVVLRHVLEHIFDIEEFLQYVRSIIYDDGYLFIEVPDWSWLDEQTDPLNFEHLNQFSTHNLVSLLRRLGWQCEAIEKSIEEDDPATPNRVQRILAKPTKIPNPKEQNIIETFNEFYSEVFGKANKAIDKLVLKMGEHKKVALYPASHLTFAALNESKLCDANIIGMFDIDVKKHGKVIEGIEIFPASKLKDDMPDVILLFTMGYEREIKESFIEMGLNAEVISIIDLLK